MTTKLPIRRFLIVMAIALLVGCAAILYRGWGKHNVETDIQNTFFPLAMALRSYQADYRSPAENLRRLVPHYISRIPSSRFADAIECSVIDDGREWQLSIRSRAFAQQRLYLYRSTQKLTPDEAERVLEPTPHGMLFVLRER